MKLIIKSKTKKTYFVQLPNYLDQEKIPDILEEAKWAMPKNEEIIEHYLNNDGPTNDEKKQLDIYGKIEYPMIQLDINL